MILVLAGIADRAAVTFVDDLASVTAASLFTCRDLAEQPFALHHPDFHQSAVTVGGRPVPGSFATRCSIRTTRIPFSARSTFADPSRGAPKRGPRLGRKFASFRRRLALAA